LIRRSSELGVDRVEVHHLFPAFEHQRYQSLVYHRTLTNEMFDQATDAARAFGVELRLPRRFEKSSMTGEPEGTPGDGGRLNCPLPWIATSIAENGDVAPCCGASSKVLGSLRKSNFEDIWNGRAYQDLRRTANSDKPWDVCAVCPSVWRGLNHKDENVLRAIGLAESEKPPRVHLKAFVKGTLESSEFGRRLLDTYRQFRKPKSG
jgi:radical SAM protein with 4Fe4S-binding SPASM domain